jgi:hypothetical protein
MSHQSSNCNDSHNGISPSIRRKDKIDRGTGSSSRNWWQSVEIDLGECPITLEPLSALPYPPFALSTSTTANVDDDSHVNKTDYRHSAMSSSSCSTIHDEFKSRRKTNHHHRQVSYFDGLALATYMVSRGIFQNPLTRQNLTMQDCRRLDEYLAEYCYRASEGHGKNNNSTAGPRFGNTYRSNNNKFSVAEAFALRNSVRVDMSTSATGGGSRNNNNNHVDQGAVQRMNTLRNAATAALAGLFVYADQQSRPVEDGTISHSPIPTDNDMSTPLILDWGFDLTRTVDNTAQLDGDDGGYGWTVIDDDEAAVVATRRYAYQTVQEAFPPLPSSADTDDSATRPTRVPSRAGATAPNAGPDEHLMERVRALAIQDQEIEFECARRVELAQQRQLQMALERREHRRKLRAAKLAEGIEVYQNQRMEAKEVQQARSEIEAWREEQWERLRLISERQIRLQQKRNESVDAKPMSHERITEAKEQSTIETENESNTDARQASRGSIPAEDEEEKKRAKAAAKRKRAKERKKVQKNEEASNMERIIRVEVEQARKAASVLKCAVCGQGILDCGYQKFDQTLCSPKCARAFKPDNTSR